jgi:hypothetical protein
LRRVLWRRSGKKTRNGSSSCAGVVMHIIFFRMFFCLFEPESFR